MKPFFTLFLALCLLHSVSAQQKSTKPAQNLTRALAAPPPVKSEAEFYKMMYDQAKADATQAHQDISTGYATNIGVIIATVGLILAIQLIDVKGKLKDVKNQLEIGLDDKIQHANEALISRLNSQQNSIDSINTLIARIEQDLFLRFTHQVEDDISDLMKSPSNNSEFNLLDSEERIVHLSDSGRLNSNAFSIQNRLRHELMNDSNIGQIDQALLSCIETVKNSRFLLRTVRRNLIYVLSQLSNNNLSKSLVSQLHEMLNEPRIVSGIIYLLNK